MLFPRYFKFIGWGLFIIGFILSVLVQFAKYAIPWLSYGDRTGGSSIIPIQAGNLTDEVGVTAWVLGLLLVAFAKLRNEDDATRKQRLCSMHWAVMMVSTITAGFICLLAGLSLFSKTVQDFVPASLFFFLYELNFATILIVFVGRFYYLLLKKPAQAGVKLLPYYPYNIIGKIGALLYCVIFIVVSVFNTPYRSFFNSFVVLQPFLALLVISREKNEADYTVRLKAVSISILINAILVLIVTWAFYGLQYWDVLDYLMISLQVVFLAVFYAIRLFGAKPAPKPTFV